MQFKKMKIFVTIILSSILSGCSIAPPKVDYEAFAKVLDENSAQIIGSTIDIEFPYDDWVTIVATLDGKELKSKKNAALKIVHTPAVVAPGMHSVELRMTQGQLNSYAEFTLDFKRGVTYIAKAYAEDNKYAYLWIEDFRTGEIVTPKKKVRRQASGSVIIVI